MTAILSKKGYRPCLGRHENNQLDDDESGVYNQIMHEVDSGHIAVASSDDDDVAPRPAVAAAAVSAVAPRQKNAERTADATACIEIAFNVAFNISKENKI